MKNINQKTLTISLSENKTWKYIESRNTFKNPSLSHCV